jgi:hypothetical protein
VWQDGAVLIHFPAQEQWAAVFLKFQSQSWHTDDVTGHALPTKPDGMVMIVAALVNPIGPEPEKETVTLLNTMSTAVDLSGWKLADRAKNKQLLSGNLQPGHPIVIPVKAPVKLGNRGGIITLLNAQGIKVDGVSYTQAEASQPGRTIVFR